MREPLRELTVVREQNESVALCVETPDIEQPVKFRGQEIKNRIACVPVASGGNETGGFVQGNRDRKVRTYEVAIDLDVVAGGRLRAKIGAPLPVDRDAAGGDEFIAVSPRADAGGREVTI